MAATNAFASGRKALFDDNWKFHRGGVANAEQPLFNDVKWRTLDLPHDWSMDPAPIQREGITVGPFSQLSEGGMGGADTGQTLGGEGWYRKKFTLSPNDAGKIITLYFEGVYNQSELFVNGKKIYFNPYGYTSYKVDITDYCHAPGVENTIAVRVLNVGQNSRWYAGSGIFRHVWIIKTNKIHLEEWDTFVDASEVKGKEATVKFSALIHNSEKKAGEGELQVKIFSPKGEEVYTQIEKTSLSSTVPYSASFVIKKPALWSLESPLLYRAEVVLSSEGKELDKITIPFGIRTISFSAKEGFLLNGKPVKLKGGCIHHDNGLLGAAAIDRAEERKVELMKANGYNAVRCAHNQVSEYFLDACDRLGLLVIHETFDQWQQSKRGNDYHQFFDEWSDKDLAASVRRDRNHPSIIMWSIGNEVAQRADQPEGDLISKRLVNTIKQYDTSRFTTIGANDFWDRRQFKWDTDAYRAFQNVDVAGYNYVWWKYESDHEAYPDRVIYGSESYPKDAAINWNLVEKHPYVIGDFVWTAIDYIGEAGLGHALELAEGERNPQFMGWPWYNAWCGDIDFCGEKKPQSYYRDVVWREREISMAVRPPVALGKKEVVNGWGWTDELLSWNWPGREGQTMRVNVYSRSPKVRLYQDGQLIDEKETDKENYTATFKVPYKAGELKAVNVEKNRERASTLLRTTGVPVAIRLTADRNQLKANRNDLSYVKIELVDADGYVVPDVDLNVGIRCEGEGSVIAAGNAAYDDMASFRSMNPKTFRGKAVAIVQPNGQKAGQIKLTVTAEGLPDSTLSIDTFE
ncbi:glycoside hydrolase family 2 TIM barrel-domain containing protein [Parabacteroides sp. PFB2-10]|uniref:glycoside hydrolase family 2 TIM barrel-domain containing protein n=1 Tax=Parabacteroides sp. PFB2-10 TaxID=1742405 RepID=UPI002476FEAE|nr:glycoside hydrolase family 2 TIM barrel-domain containing protein [Parabacteroides sp. PFB2-10]